MVRLKWDNEDSPMYQTGVSQGVFYGDDGVGHAWSGLVSVTEKPQNNAPTAVYNAMGEKYDNFGNVAEKKHGLACYVYPEVMDDYLGYEYLEDFGFVADERPPKKFHMAYRVELGNGLYEIHVLLNQIATFGETARQTVADSLALSTITMNLEGAVDPRIGTSHIRLDSRLPITKSAEALLFGDQYTEANIHDFLTAEPVWETVATNYAPIIEPDYDNMVWLGGENLLHDSHVTSNTDGYLANSLYTTNSISEDVMVTITIKGKLASGRTRFSIRNSSDSVHLAQAFEIQPGLYVSSFRWTVGSTSNDHIKIYSGWHTDEYHNSPGDTYIEWVKLEYGDTPTPWTPAPSDSDQKPRPSDPYPENYKPGLANYIADGVEAIAYYDEMHGGIGVYPTNVNNLGSRIPIKTMPIEQIRGSYMRASTDIVVTEHVEEPTTLFARVQVSHGTPRVTTPHVPLTRGTYTREAYVESTAVAYGPYETIFLYHGGTVGSAPIVYKNVLVTPNPNVEFFDINTPPASRGDRYIRVRWENTIRNNADYTIHQQLRLRSTGKVKLSDITQYDFWLEAADSMLLSQNETFTFNGPQAVIDGDTFTIDDSIQGYAEG